jgi:hypothetical protein
MMHAKKVVKKKAKKKAVKGSHVMPDGTVMKGKKHKSGY